MKRIYIPLLFLFLCLFCTNLTHATVFNAIADGNWNEPTIWDQGSVPGSLDTVIIDGYIVTINDVTGNVAVKHLVLTNASNAGFSQLIIMEAVTVIVIDDLEATSENINQDVEVRIRDNATLNVNGNVDFTRVNTNNTTHKLILNLKNASRMNVGGNFTYDYENSHIDETTAEIKLQNTAVLDVTGNTALYMRGGKNLTFRILDSALAFLRGHLDAYLYGGQAMRIDNSGILNIGGNLNMNSVLADKAMFLQMFALTSVTKVTGDVSMSALSEGDVYIDLKSTSNLYIGGEFLRPTNYGALLMEATSTLTYNGTLPQVLAADNLTGSGTDAFNFTNVVLDNSSGFALADTVSVADNFNLTNGIITTTSANILIIGDSATVTGGNASNYVDGPMIKEGRTIGDRFVFPIGDGSLYAPLGISKISTSSSQYTAQAFGDPPPFGNTVAADVGTISEYQYWELSKTPGSEDVDVTLNWMDAAANGITNLESTIVVGLNEANVWENFGNGGTTGGTGSGVLGSVSTLDGDPPPFGVIKFTIGTLPPVEIKIILPGGLNGINGANELLPVELTRFYAYLQEDKVSLKWQTASEINTSHFVIECTMDGHDFKEVGTILSKGESDFIQNYSTIDASPSKGINCYRLKIVDRDGSYEYSKIVAVNFVKSQVLSIYPNPVNKVLHLKGMDSKTDEGILEVFGISGQRIYTGKCVLENGRFQISTNAINIHTPGNYIVRFTSATESHVLKFNKF